MAEGTREQFVHKVIEIIKGKFPLVKVARAEQTFSLLLNGHVASLENVYRMSQLRPDEVQHNVERWVVELLRASEGTPDNDAPFDEVQDRILPMVLSQGSTEVQPNGVVSQPWVADLHLAYALDSDRTITYISLATFKKWGKSIDDLHEVAVKNLVDRSQEISAHAAQDEDGRVNLILFQTMDGFDASRLLLPTLHERLREHLGSNFIASVPNRDILLCFRDDPETVDRLRAQVEKDFRQMPHPVTDRLLIVTADGIAARG